MSQQSPSGGYSIFHGTMADMTFPEVMQAAADRVAAKIGVPIRAVMLPQAEAGIDVDKPGDHALAEAILAARKS